MADATYPLALPSVRLSVNYSDRSHELMAGTLRVISTLGSQIDTCTFTLKAPESWRNLTSQKPVEGQPVLVETKTGSGAFGAYFGGSISKVNEVRIATATVVWACECVDYTNLLSRVVVNKMYTGWNVGDIVRDVVRQYAPQVIVNQNVQNCTTIIDKISFPFVYPINIIETLAEMSGYQWFVGPDRVLNFFPATSNTSPNEITDTSDNYYNLAISPQLNQVRNRIWVTGGVAESDTVVETWDVSGAENGTFNLNHTDIKATLVSGNGEVTPFMRLNGIEQTVIFAGIDISAFPGCYVLDPAIGQVRPGDYNGSTYIPQDGDKIEFNYKYNVPIAVMREDTDSQATVASLDGTAYSTVVASGLPIFYWRLGETSGAYQNSGTGGLTYSGMQTATGLQRGIEGALQGDPNLACQFQGGRIATLSGTQCPLAKGTLEAWVSVGLEQLGTFANGQPAYRQVGIVGQWDDTPSIVAAGGGGGVMLWLTSGGTYGLGYNGGGADMVNNQHLLTVNVSGRPSGGGQYDHVVAGWDNVAGQRKLWVNNTLVGADNFFQPHGVIPGSGIEIGNYDYFRGFNAPQWPSLCKIDEVAVYDYLISGETVNAHYQSGRYAGVREYVVNNTALSSFDSARKIADSQLDKWAQVITPIEFESFLSGWAVGDTITVNVTASATGRNYSGTALIQQVDAQWIGNQRVRYLVHCESARFNVIDWQKSIVGQQKFTGTTTNLQVINTEHSTAALLVGSTLASGATPPFRIGPDPGVSVIHPTAVVGFSLVS